MPSVSQSLCLASSLFGLYLVVHQEFNDNYWLIGWFFAVYTMTLVANILGGLILLFHAGLLSNLFLAIFYTLLFTPASYVCWYVYSSMSRRLNR